MFDLSKVCSTNAVRAHCTIIHGVGGVGKTTFGAKACMADNGLMILGEDGLSPLGMEKIPRVIVGRWGTVDSDAFDNSGESLQDILHALIATDHPYKTVVIDTFDSLMPMLDSYVVHKYYKGDTEKADAYKAKYVEYYSETNKILKGISLLLNKGIQVFILVHSIITDFKNPSSENFQRWSLNLPGGTKTSLADLLYNFADNCLFAAYDIVVSNKKGDGKRRVLFTEWHPSYDAKNRYRLPVKTGMDDYTVFQKLIK